MPEPEKNNHRAEPPADKGIDWLDVLSKPAEVKVLSEGELQLRLDALDWRNSRIAYVNTDRGVKEVDAFTLEKIFGKRSVQGAEPGSPTINTGDFDYVRYPDGRKIFVQSTLVYESEFNAKQAVALAHIPEGLLRKKKD